MKILYLSIVVGALFFSSCGKKDMPQTPQPVVPAAPPSYIDTFDCTVHRVYHETDGPEATVSYEINIDSTYNAMLMVDRSKKDSVIISGTGTGEYGRFAIANDGKYHKYPENFLRWDRTFVISGNSISAIFDYGYFSLSVITLETKTFTGVKR